ncbi:MAG TPA: phosphatase PAP2 family protein [Candidatus Sulfopaludibacter sp.]|nr:phosphatase PAP2 family protein [Candidatus Sulfopaludibacter sp.]
MWCQTQTPPPPPPPNAERSSEPHSAIAVKPGGEVIKQKDIWNETGIFHPFVRMPKYIWQDQKAIWTSPFHTKKKDIKFWAIFGGATAAFIATDKSLDRQLPNSSSQISVSNWGSRLGAAYTLIPVSAGFYFIGTADHADRFRETGLLCFEALIDSNITVAAVKMVADRARPTESDGKGHFEDSPNGRWNSSFPSGHAINTWAMASIIAHQYPHPRYVPVIVYALATTVVAARVGARQHFPGDVVAGSALGWFIGDYVYGKRHNTDLDPKQSAAQKILDHVHLGFSME